MSLKINLGVPEFILKMGNPNGRYVYEFGDFRLDASHRMLYCNDEELALAPKAVETLVALVERRGAIVSKDELLETVWPDAIVEESNLFLYLSVLRKTLGTQKDGKPWVETLRRRGYRFSADVRARPVDDNGTLLPVSSLRVVNPKFLNSHENATVQPPDRVLNRPAWGFGQSVYTAAGIIAILLAVAFGYQYFLAKHPIKSVAVLPFAYESADRDAELVYDGMTINLTGSLVKIPGLDVKASSTMLSRYKGSNLDAATIGKELNVEAVLAPRMVQHGDNLTLYVELVDSQTENSLWQQNYDGKSSHLGILSSNVMRDVVHELRVDVSDSTRQRLANDYSESAEATRLYLKGVVLIHGITEPTIREGIGYLRQATVHDPYYAPAFANIASAHRGLTLCCDGSPSELEEAKRAALRAIQLDENSGEAHSALAAVLFFYDWNSIDAEKHFVRALELDPNSAIIHYQYADFLARMGRAAEAKSERSRTTELEPYSPFFNAFALGDAELDDKTLESARRVIELDPNFYFSHLATAGIYLEMKMYPEAIAEYQRAKELAPENTWIDVQYSRVFIKRGDVEQSRAILEELLRRSQSHYVPPFHIAAVYKQLDDSQQALTWLEKAYQERDPKMTFLKAGVGWKKLEADPRFQDIKRRVGI